jgi:hypothetical protein
MTGDDRPLIATSEQHFVNLGSARGAKSSASPAPPRAGFRNWKPTCDTAHEEAAQGDDNNYGVRLADEQLRHGHTERVRSLGHVSQRGVPQVKAGGKVTGIDITLLRSRVYNISDRVTRSANWKLRFLRERLDDGMPECGRDSGLGPI